MKTKGILQTIAILGLLVAMAATTWATSSPWPSWFNYPRLKPVTNVERGQDADFELTFSFINWLDTSVTCPSVHTLKRIWLADTTDVTMRIEVSVLNYEGTLSKETITLDPDGDSVYVLRFSVYIPDEDTLCVVTDLDQAGFKEQRACYFVWNGEEMELRLMNPRLGPDKPDYNKVHPFPPPKRLSSRPPGDSVLSHSFDAGIGSDSSGPRDVVLSKIHELEKEPLLDRPFQRIKVDGNTWLRWRGDKEFLLNPTAEDIHVRASAIRDSLAALPGQTVVKVVLNLPDSTARSKAREVVGQLPAPTLGTQYILEIINSQVEQLREAGLYPEYWEVNPIQPSQGGAKGEGDSSLPPESGTFATTNSVTQNPCDLAVSSREHKSSALIA